MDGDKTEHVAEFVRVLGRYCSAIGVRTFAALEGLERRTRRSNSSTPLQNKLNRADREPGIGNAPSVSVDGRHDDHPREAGPRDANEFC